MKLLRSLVIFLFAFLVLTVSANAQNVEHIINKIQPKSYPVLDNSGRIVCDAWHLDSVIYRKLSERLGSSNVDVSEKIQIRQEIWRNLITQYITGGYTEVFTTAKEETIESMEKPGGGFWLRSTGQIKSKLAPYTTLLRKPATNQFVIALSPYEGSQRLGGCNKIALSIGSSGEQVAENRNSGSNEGIFGTSTNSEQESVHESNSTIKIRTSENQKKKVYVDFQNINNSHLNENSLIDLTRDIFDHVNKKCVVTDIRDEADEILLISDVTFYSNSQFINKPRNQRYNNTIDNIEYEARRPIDRVDGVVGDVSRVGSVIVGGVIKSRVKREPGREENKVKIDFTVSILDAQTENVIAKTRTFRSFTYVASEDPEGGRNEKQVNNNATIAEMESAGTLPDSNLVEETRITNVAIGHQILKMYDLSGKYSGRKK